MNAVVIVVAVVVLSSGSHTIWTIWWQYLLAALCCSVGFHIATYLLIRSNVHEACSMLRSYCTVHRHTNSTHYYYTFVYTTQCMNLCRCCANSYYSSSSSSAFTSTSPSTTIRPVTLRLSISFFVYLYIPVCFLQFFFLLFFVIVSRSSSTVCVCTRKYKSVCLSIGVYVWALYAHTYHDRTYASVKLLDGEERWWWWWWRNVGKYVKKINRQQQR